MRGDEKRSSSLPRAVIVLGWVSFFTDASADMIYPLVPAFLMSLGGGATALGWLEGVAEAVSAGIKLWAGRSIDKAAHPKRFVVAGYGIAALARPLYALATAPVHAVLVRVADRVGKGLRGPPRDAMLAAAVDPARRGHAFGYHRMMDNFGGVAGPLLAFVFLRLAELPLRQVFVLSVVPGLASVVIAQVFLKEPPKHPESQSTGKPESQSATGAETQSANDSNSQSPHKPESQSATGAESQSTRDPKSQSTDKPEGQSTDKPAPGEVEAARALPWGFFLVTGVFALAASGDLFLMRRLTDLGLDVAYVPVAWVSLQLMKGLFNVPGGRASDTYGRRPVLAVAWGVYSATYFAFGLASTWWAAWMLIVPYALHYGLAEGGQKALLTDLAPKSVRGRAFGVQLAIEGVIVLPANVGFGWLSDRFGARAAFWSAGGCALLAAVLLLLVVPGRRPEPARD
ncbi:MAG: MFS transporter [Polyangiaceae bacterium]